jgi:hypothetical protein
MEGWPIRWTSCARWPFGGAVVPDLADAYQ